MDSYCELNIPVAEDELRSILVARLAEMGYDGFEETETALKAYIPETGFDALELDNLFNKYSLTYSKSVINKQNWNQLWESNFEPVQVEDFVGVRASFHQPFTDMAHEIVITPKMSFGTGHHATTWLVMRLMRDLDCMGKAVLDFGTGTGILAILASKLGASRVSAVDNDDWCIENASENIRINICNNIDIHKVDAVSTASDYDIILANINRHIILANIGAIARALVMGGELILSGLLVEDEEAILSACRPLGLEHRATVERSGWIALRFFRNS